MLRRSSTLSILRRKCPLLSATWASSAVRPAKMSSAAVRRDASCFRELVRAPFATASSSAPTGQPGCESAGTWPRHRCRGSTFRITNGITTMMPSVWVAYSWSTALAHNTLYRSVSLITGAPHRRTRILETGRISRILCAVGATPCRAIAFPSLFNFCILFFLTRHRVSIPFFFFFSFYFNPLSTFTLYSRRIAERLIDSIARVTNRYSHYEDRTCATSRRISFSERTITPSFARIFWRVEIYAIGQGWRTRRTRETTTKTRRREMYRTPRRWYAKCRPVW